MYTAREIALYFLSKDTDKSVFTKNLIERNGRKFYEGNAKLNKFLHFTQVLYIAKTGEKLFSDDLYAYANGAVALDVQENFAMLLVRPMPNHFSLPLSIRNFLDKVFIVFKEANIDELISMSHEDEEWKIKHKFDRKYEQRMDMMAHADDYQADYQDILNLMDTMLP